LIRPLLLAIASLGLLGLATLATAQTPGQTKAPPSGAAQAMVRKACMSSIMNLCSAEAMSGDRPATRACLIRNLDKTNPECQVAVKAAAKSAGN
jgi:hypothetical protein